VVIAIITCSNMVMMAMMKMMTEGLGTKARTKQEGMMF